MSKDMSSKRHLTPDDPEMLEAVKEVRILLENELKNNSDQYCAEDIQRVRDVDFEVRRFLYLTKFDPVKTVELIKERLRWRRETGFSEMKPDSFPSEFYECGSVFEFKTDEDGHPVLYIRSKFNVKSETLSRPIRQFLLYNMDLIDQRMAEERSWGMVFDGQGFTWQNIDFDFLHLIIKTLRNYMPWSVKYIIIYEIPRLLESVWRGVQKFIPEDGKKLVKVRNKQTISEFIEPSNIPKVIGGGSNEDFIKIPQGCKTCKEIGYVGNDMERIEKQFEKMIIADRNLLLKL